MTRRLTILPEVALDVGDATAWYDDQRTGLGNEFLDELDVVVQRVVQSPFQFPQIKNDVRRALLRRFPYSLYFRVLNEVIELIAVLHQHRDPRTWENRIVAE